MQFYGKVVGNYKLQDEIGRGNYGVVYRGTNIHGAEVAIKLERINSGRILLLQNEYNMYKVSHFQ